MYTVLEFYRANPGADALEAINYFEKELEIPKQIEILKNEVDEVLKVRRELRVLRGKKAEAEERVRLTMSDIEMEVYLEYPPRKGTDAQREQLRSKLQSESPSYQEAKEAFKEASVNVVDKEDELNAAESRGKNARRLIEVFKTYTSIIQELKG